MATLKNLMTIFLFAAMPLFILLSVQTSPANSGDQIYQSPGLENELSNILKKANRTSILLRPLHLQ